jgi:His-Xaa-Ser system radical SAM maturase HxsB
VARNFYTIETYGGKPGSYSLLPFRFLALSDRREVLVNDVGDYLIAERGTANALAQRTLDTGSDLYRTLKAKQFLYDANSAPLLDILATKYRTKKSSLTGFTKLHIFVVTLRCDHSCHYCQVSRQSADRSKYDMALSTAMRSLELMMASPSKAVTLEFQGGEPLLAFDRIKEIVPRAKELAAAKGKALDIVVVSNLANATDDMLRYFRDERVKLSTSLDGPAFIHNANRPRPGNNSYELTVQNVQRARDILGVDQVAALMTTTRLSLDYPVEIIDEYVRLDFRSIFLRPISPYGFAVKSRHRTGYEMERFLAFYQRGLDYILTLNKQGVDLQEVYAKIILTKILTPYSTGYVDLQSPAGAGVSVLVYNYDGDVYASDEARMLAEMRDTTFRLGNVHRDSHRSIFTGDGFRSLIAASCNETLPGCAECAFQPYCGADPVFHHATQGDSFGHRPTSAFCYKNMEIIKYLFGLIGRSDRDINRILFAWVRNQSINDMGDRVTTCG